MKENKKRVCNPEVETVVSPLGLNLFMYAGSFFVGNSSCIYCPGKGIINYLGSVSTG